MYPIKEISCKNKLPKQNYCQWTNTNILCTMGLHNIVWSQQTHKDLGQFCGQNFWPQKYEQPISWFITII